MGFRKTFNVTYVIHEKEKNVSIDCNIPEEISANDYKLRIYLAQEIAKRERAKEDDVLVSAATCTFMSS